MKKIITTLFIFASALGITRAQSLGTSGVTPVVYGASTDFTLTTTFSVDNNSGNPITVKVQRYDLSIVAGSDNTFCWGGTCFGNTTYLSPNSVVVPAGSSEGSFIGDYYPNGIAGVTTVGYKFFDMNNTSDSVFVAINYDASATGINNPDATADFLSVGPNPANNMSAINYRFKDNRGELRIYDVLGNLVRTVTPKSQSGTMIVTVNDLKQGVYIVSMLSNGKSVANSRLVVKH